MASPSRFKAASIVLLASAMTFGSAAFADPLAILDPTSLENGAARVAPSVPCGKTLVLPLPTNAADGDLLNFTVRSSNPRVMARVKTGNPILRVNVSYAGTTGFPAFTGTMDFQLFRDLTPVTAEFISGFSQAGFYNNVIFHRIADLNDDKDVSTPRLDPSFILQTGDPLGTGSGGPGMTNNAASSAFKFQNEFNTALIFSGRGQLAMANSGYNKGTSFGSGFIQLGDFRASNGSQFFINLAQPRFLDFKHTIFGQLVRGFDIMEKIAAVPRFSRGLALVAANDAPSNGKLAQDLTFQVKVNGAANPTTVTVLASDTAANTSISDLVADFNASLTAAGLATQLAADVTGAKVRVRSVNSTVTSLVLVSQTPTFFTGTTSNGDSVYGGGTDDKPTAELKMTSTTVLPGGRDATLMLSAAGVGDATITVTATGNGETAQKAFVVHAVDDTHNDPPILFPVPNIIAPVGVTARLPLSAQDLEHDYLLYGIPSASGATNSGSFGLAQIASRYTPTATAGFQDVPVGVAGYNDPRRSLAASSAAPFGAFDAYNVQVAELAYGDKAMTASPTAFDGTANVALPSTILAEFRDSDAAGLPADFTALVNWGDGTPEQSTTQANPAITIVRSNNTPGTLVVKGAHTFAQPGFYRVKVLIDSPLGATATVRSRAMIYAAGATLKAQGRDLQNSGPTVSNKVIATFTDSTPGVLPSAFTARIDWGDGVATAGVIRRTGASTFTVSGTHAYRDAENYSVAVKIARITPAASVIAWSDISIVNFRPAPHLPPFSMPHLVGEISEVSGKQFKTTANNQTRFTVQMVIVNSGDKASPEATLSFHLSPDTKLNTTPTTDADNTVTPADKAVAIGPRPSVKIQSLPPGAGVRYLFDVAPEGDFRLKPPAGETGSGLYLLGHFAYADPIADHMDIDRDVAFGAINGIIVSKSTLTVTEAAGPQHSAQFTVVLDKAPTQDVKIPLSVSDDTEGKIDKTELTFTSTTWNVPQTVTVTAKDDLETDGSVNFAVRLDAAVSLDPLWNQMDGDDVQVTNIDNDGGLTVTPTTLSTSEAAGTDHTKTFTVVLTRQPTGDVTIPLSITSITGGADPNEGTIDKQSLTFTAANWNQLQTVTVTAVDDAVDDGDVKYLIHLGPATSTDSFFNNRHSGDLIVTNVDNEPTPTP